MLTHHGKLRSQRGQFPLTQFLPITVVGLIYLGREGLSLGQIAAASREEVGSSV